MYLSQRNLQSNTYTVTRSKATYSYGTPGTNLIEPILAIERTRLHLLHANSQIDWSRKQQVH